jgi:hypothetical protein
VRFRWWRIQRLQRELAAQSLPLTAQLGYLTLFLFIEIFSWGLDTEVFGFSWNDQPRAYWSSIGIPLFAVKLLGPWLCYVAYRPADPRRFLERFFALSGPIRNWILLLLLLGILPARAIARFAEAFLHLQRGTIFGGAGVGIFWLLFDIAHYAWLAASLRFFAKSADLMKNAEEGGKEGFLHPGMK